MSQAAKLKWMCRRGMKELDIMLCAYLERCYPAATDNEKAAFEGLLHMQDPVIYNLLMQHTSGGQADIDDLVKKIRGAVKA